jgi:hypothetical protein
MTDHRRLTTLLLFLVLLASTAGAAEHPSLAKARALYNAGDFDGAISAAAVSRRVPGNGDASALVIARSHLERYRQRADPADLAAARDALASVRSDALTPRDQVDLLVGLGQSLYLSEVFGAAAELFDTAVSRGAQLPERDRLLLLDWWATALDREAQTRAPERRERVFERIAERMETELREDPANAAANYWLAVAARGIGDVDRAWDAAVAAWVRSTLRPEASDALRTDLDRLVTQALIPERARARPAGEQTDSLATLRAEWDLVKQQWK